MSQLVQTSSRRQTPRVPGPFDGRRRGALTVNLRIHDLSAGGCLIESFYEVAAGRHIKLDIELPYVGWVTLDAVTLYTRPDFGFAVKFVDVPPVTHDTLEYVIQRLLTKSPLDE